MDVEVHEHHTAQAFGEQRNNAPCGCLIMVVLVACSALLLRGCL